VILQRKITQLKENNNEHIALQKLYDKVAAEWDQQLRITDNKNPGMVKRIQTMEVYLILID
jgi:hypothetical protein